MNLTDQDLAAIKSLMDSSNTALETKLTDRINGLETRFDGLETRLIKRIDDLDFALTAYIDNGLRKVRRDIRTIKKTLQSV